MKPPAFWHQKTCSSRVLAIGLAPLGWIYGTLVQTRLKFGSTTKVSVPVICVGNITLGGTGKTPSVIYLVGLLRNLGYTPHILTRGYGGTLEGITQVDPEKHTATQVGDEPLLLAKQAPVWRGKDRVAAAHQAIKAGATILIMDDGLQNPSLYKDISLAIFDGTSQIGNGQIFPAGPLRQSLRSGLDLSDGAFLLNFDNDDFQERLAELKADTNLFAGRVQSDARPESGQKYLAFAGIGVPEKFFKTLRELGYPLGQTISYPDHHLYTPADLQQLKEKASSNSLKLITTEKDAIKLPSVFLNNVDVVRITLNFANEEGMIRWLQDKLG